MARVVRGALGFLFGVLIAFVWLVPVRAETIAATGSPAGSPVAALHWRGYSYSGCNAGQCATCQAAGEVLLARSSGFSACRDIGGGYWSADFVSPANNVIVYPTCPSGSVKGSGSNYCISTTSSYQCPAGQNWTLQGDQCFRPDCPMGYRKADGTCDPCPAGKYAVRELAGHLGADDSAPRWGSPFELSLSGSGAAVPDSVCHQGCTLDLAGGDLNFAGSGGPSGQWSWLGAPKFSGATCSASSADPVAVQPNGPEAACVAAGQGYGTVNGTVVCVPQVDTKRREVKEVTGPAGGKTVTVENQVCTGGSCTSTTTVTHSGGGAAGGQADGSSTSSAVGGSSTKGDGSSACEENPFSAACLGNGATQEGLGQGDGGGGISSISPVSLPGAAVCPADLQLPHGVTLPFRHACEFAVLVRPFVLILGWLSAGFFVVGGLRSG